MMENLDLSEDTEALERRWTLYLLGEAVEKLARLRRILTRQRRFVDVDTREYAGVIEPLFSQLEDQEERLVLNSARISSLLRKEFLDEAQLIALQTILKTVIAVVLSVHELLILLPREAVEPQVFLLLRECFGNAWRPTSVVMANALSSYEYRIDDLLDELEGIGQDQLKQWRAMLKGFTRSGSVLAQAFVDRDNPLAWAVLTHEYGHALDEGQRICEQIVGGDQVLAEKPQRDPKIRWVSEVFADFVAARVLGPASQVPVLLLEMSRPLMKASDEAPSHPPTVVRLRLVRDYLKKLGVDADGFEEVFEIYNFDYRRKMSALAEAERSKRESLERMVNEFLQAHFGAIALRVDALDLTSFSDKRAHNARKLQEKLHSDLPISSLRLSSGDEIRASLTLLTDKATRNQVYEILSQFNEVPAASSEILMAGWLYKLSSFEETLRKAFPATTSGDNPELGVYGRYLARTDELLIKSLGLADVQRNRSAGGAGNAAFGN
jgi:hypothetical protein